MRVRDSLANHQTGNSPVGADARPRNRAVTHVAAQALGALAVGALAIGALTIGALAIGRLAVGRARIRRLEIDELVVHRLRVVDELQVPAKPDAP